MIQLYNVDCMKALQGMNDDEFDLAIVDPPYGGSKKGSTKIDNIPRASRDKNVKKYKANWNIAPPEEYFTELRRVSKNQIIWGGNYFSALWDKYCRGFVIWDKCQISKLHADCEFAYTSFDCNAKIFKYRSAGAHLGDSLAPPRIHPTQKPIALYEFLLQRYANKGDRILDTHLGSGSIALACHNLGFDLVGYEIDSEYYTAASKRLKDHQRQLNLF